MKKTKRKISKRFHFLLRFGGVCAIVLFGALVTYFLYQHEVEDQVFMNNYTTSVLFSDSLASASGAAPWALLSLNWFLCRSGVKRWLHYCASF